MTSGLYFFVLHIPDCIFILQIFTEIISGYDEKDCDDPDTYISILNRNPTQGQYKPCLRTTRY